MEEGNGVKHQEFTIDDLAVEPRASCASRAGAPGPEGNRGGKGPSLDGGAELYFGQTWGTSGGEVLEAADPFSDVRFQGGRPHRALDKPARQLEPIFQRQFQCRPTDLFRDHGRQFGTSRR